MKSFTLTRRRAATKARSLTGRDSGQIHVPNPTPWVNDDGTAVVWQYDGAGRVVGEERWLYVVMPGKRLLDGRSDDTLGFSHRLNNALANLQTEHADPIVRAFVNHDREIHLLALTWPEVQAAPAGSSDAYGQMLSEHVLGQLYFMRRTYFLGIRLASGVGLTVRQAANNMWQSARGKVEAPDWTAFADDEARARRIMSDIGCRAATSAELHMLLTWDSRGTDLNPLRAAESTSLVVNEAYRWQFAALSDPGRKVLEPGQDLWMAQMMSLPTGAPDVVSIKARLIPAEELLKSLSKTSRVATSNVQRTAESRDGVDASDVAQLNFAQQVRFLYSGTKAPAFTDVVVVAGVQVPLNPDDKRQESFVRTMEKAYDMQWTPLVGRQDSGLFDCLPGSRRHTQAPIWQTCTTQQVANMGFGDDPSLGDAKGVFMATTPNGRMVLADHLRAAEGDMTPAMLVIGSSGSGKTQTMQWLAYSYYLQGVPGVLINPKIDAPLTGLAKLLNANVASLSDAGNEPGGGALDPFTWAKNPELAAEFAYSYLTSVFGSVMTAQQLAQLEVSLSRAARAGARCVGDALSHISDPEIVRYIRQKHESNSLFRLAVGLTPRESLLGSESNRAPWTIVEMDRPINLEGDPRTNEDVRLGRATMSLIVMSSYQRLVAAGGGVLFGDEFHVMLKDQLTRKAFDYINRNARSHRVLPILASQRPADFADELGNSDWQPSRVLVLRQQNSVEAEAALRLVRMEPTPERIEQLMNAGAKRPTADSPGRPPFGFFLDPDGRHGLVVMGRYPDWFLAATSTNALDIDRRLTTAA